HGTAGASRWRTARATNGYRAAVVSKSGKRAIEGCGLTGQNRLHGIRNAERKIMHIFVEHSRRASCEITIGRVVDGGNGMRPCRERRGRKGCRSCDQGYSAADRTAIVFECGRACRSDPGAAGIRDGGLESKGLTDRCRIRAARKRQRRRRRGGIHRVAYWA